MIPSRVASSVLVLLLAAAPQVLGQTPPAPRVDPAPPPPPDLSGDQELEPQITVIRHENDTSEEVRVRGELRYIRVTPRGGGRSYYLIPEGNGNTFLRRDSLDPTLKVPMWVLFSF